MFILVQNILVVLSLVFTTQVLFAQDISIPVTANKQVAGEAGKSLQRQPATLPSINKMIVKAIEIKGNKTIGLSSILAKIKTKVGQDYNQRIISDDLKRLYNTGYFTSNVRVDREDYNGGFKVIFFVEEKPIIEDVTFSKLRHLRPRTIMRKIKTQKGRFLDERSLSHDVKTIEELYAQKGFVLVDVRVEKEIDSLTNKATVHFVIKEGQRVQIRRIFVEGNRTFKDKKIFRVIKSRKKGLFNSGYLKEEVLEEDMERIKSFYEKEGFIDARAKYRHEEHRSGRVNVFINVEEGKRYFVESINVEGNEVLAKQKILDQMMEIKVGDKYSKERLSIDLQNIRTLYFDEGYIYADVIDSTSLNDQTGKVDVKLKIIEGELAYISKIKIQGNDRTRDIVIRRELKLYPGDRFNGELLRKSKQRLRELGYFEDIGYDIEDTDSTNKKNLLVQVKEAKTGSFSIGGGYSTVDQLVGFIEIEQKNFDVTNWPTFIGAGQNVLLRLEAGSTRNNMQLSFTDPWLFDYPITGGFDAYLTDRDRERDVGYAYDERRVGGDLRLGKSFTEYISGGLTYRFENIQIGNFDSAVSTDLLAEEGDNKLSSLAFSLARDSRDSRISPTKGLFLSGVVDWAGGVLGGDKDFVRFTSRASYDYPLKFNSVLEFRLKAGVADAYGDTGKVPIFERFYAGGARSIRGYNERQVGPLDTLTDDPIGGESLLVGNIEYIFPIIDFVKLTAFYDVGNVWPKVQDFCSGDFKSGVGMGLRIRTPIGPVGLDYGYPLNDEPGEEERQGKFYFSVSRGF